ncbi:MAG: hypothetical protein CVU56_07290 [Deltaproteobacteria bacterium HGW-Deltaproteobacteria-14]|jgi:hypothetical protein|nr:MAG: hypothetical protein CVU56_07290 [Deltaproteobacteria bacterium HGW-Deltaproteobacteria-14]
MDGPNRRWRGLERAAALLPRSVSRDLGSWERLVGPTLAAETAMVGLDPGGVLRVAARNEAARNDLVARSVDVLAAFNVMATAMKRRRATSLSCWVAASFTAAPRERQAHARPPAPPDPGLLAQARVEAARLAPGADPEIAELLALWRARTLARRRSDET